MSDSSRPILVLGATGKTGSRVTRALHEHGLSTRTAARSQADVHFDWTVPATFEPAVTGTSAIYLVAPVMRVDFAPVVADLLDAAVQAGVGHVSFLSAYGMEHAPADVALRAVELDLAGRSELTHSLIRPAWFMQDFTETFLRPVNGEIVVPNGAGAEAFVSAEDIAAVAAATLADPEAHAGTAYSPTGPDALTMTEATAIISEAVGITISYRDTNRAAWVQGMVDAGVPAAYGAVLHQLTETIAAGQGSRPNNDVLRATGAAPESFKSFAQRNAPVWNPAGEQ